MSEMILEANKCLSDATTIGPIGRNFEQLWHKLLSLINGNAPIDFSGRHIYLANSIIKY